MSRYHKTGPSQRQLRVGEELRHALAEIMMRGELRDPDLTGLSITVSQVAVSPDLRNATAYVLPLGGGDVERALAGLGRAAPYLRGQLARMVRLRAAPRLSFVADDVFDQASGVEALLRTERVARDLGAPADAAPGAADGEEPHGG